MKKVILFLFLLLSVVSCKKYEDGPLLSVRTKTHRLVNSWKVESVIRQDGIDITADFNSWYPNYMLTITRENKYTENFTMSTGTEHLETGTWAYNGDKTAVLLTKDSGGRGQWDIMRLKEKEFWGKKIDVSFQVVYVVHFKPAF